ncbi:hypothetical protein Tco_0605324 [Tanacetum coccineum]
MTGNQKLFSTYKAYNGGNVIFGSNLRGNIIGKGQICDNKCRVTFSEHDSEITKDGKVIGYSQNSKSYIILNKYTRKVKDSLNVTFDETHPPSKTSPLVDDDLDEEEAIKVTKKKNLENDIVDETLEIDEIVNIKESRNHPLENNRLLLLFKTKPTRFKRYKSFFHELQGRYGYLFAHLRARFMPRKSFDTLAYNLHDVMVETLPAMVDKHIKEQVVKQVPEQVRNQVLVYVAEGLILKRKRGKEETEILIAKGILQERGNIQAQILTQIENAIANVWTYSSCSSGSMTNILCSRSTISIVSCYESEDNINCNLL